MPKKTEESVFEKYTLAILRDNAEKMGLSQDTLEMILNSPDEEYRDEAIKKILWYPHLNK